MRHQIHGLIGAATIGLLGYTCASAVEAPLSPGAVCNSSAAPAHCIASTAPSASVANIKWTP
jgi:hypothetical protein